MEKPLTTTLCAGPVVGRNGGLVVIACHACSLNHLYPLPSEEDQQDLYENFWDGEIPDSQDYIQKDKPWLWRAYRNLISKIERILPHPWSMMDVGCGTGDFLEFIANRPGWRPMGVDPDPKARQLSQRWGAVWPSVPLGTRVSCVAMNQVLEHLRDPYTALMEARAVLKPGGTLLVSTPNDFSGIQKWAERRVGRKWWIHRHHVNYFTPHSLKQILGEAGFEVVYQTTSFPMELFLFFTNYTKSAATGRRIHSIRKFLDRMGVGVLYPWMARHGVGRHITVIARRV